MAERNRLPDAPDPSAARTMASCFSVSADYDGGVACRTLFQHIEDGRITFEFPNRLQLTKRGQDFLRLDRPEGSA